VATGSVDESNDPKAIHSINDNENDFVMKENLLNQYIPIATIIVEIVVPTNANEAIAPKFAYNNLLFK
jgi:hypothetical protein